MTAEQNAKLAVEMEMLFDRSRTERAKGNTELAEVYHAQYSGMKKALEILGYKVEINCNCIWISE